MSTRRLTLSVTRTITYKYINLQQPYKFQSPFSGEFVLLLQASDPTVSDPDRVELCREFVNAGCRYALCRGYDCKKWHDTIDLSYVEDESRPFIMTTWNEDEPLEDTVEFMILNTSFEDYEPDSFCIVEVGGEGFFLENVRKNIKTIHV